jgi:hypothetical protein
VGGSGALSYQWTADNTPISGATSATFMITREQAGRTIRVVVSRADNTGSVTSAPLAGGVVPFGVVLIVSGAANGDIIEIDGMPTVSPLPEEVLPRNSGRAGDRIRFNYNLTSGGTANSSLTFTGASGLSPITAASSGVIDYTVRAADAVNGIITINATFMHTNLELRTLTFAEENRTVVFGSEPFTNAAAASAGGGSVTYESSAPEVATVAAGGRVTIVGVGAATITAAIAATSSHVSATASFTVTVTRAAAANAPVGLTVTPQSAPGVNDGAISGVTAAMEFRAADSDGDLFTAITGDALTGLAPGTYLVRFAATATHEASEPAEVVVGEYAEPPPEPCGDCGAFPCECPEPPPVTIRWVTKDCECCATEKTWLVTRFTQRLTADESARDELMITERWAIKRGSSGELVNRENSFMWMTRIRQCAVTGDTLASYTMCLERGVWVAS